MDFEFLENLQEKNPKIIAEYFFENYEYHEINKLVKQIQKKIMEKNNSLKLMLSHRYVDLLDCSELIENLKHYSDQMSGIAERNAKNIKHSLEFISEKKSVPVEVAEPKKISNIAKCILLQQKALELGNRNLDYKSLVEKIYFLVLFLINTDKVKDAPDARPDQKRVYVQNANNLKELLSDLVAKTLSSLNQLIASSYILDKKEVFIAVLGVIRGVQYLAIDSSCRVFLNEIIEDLVAENTEGQLTIPSENDTNAILDFAFTLTRKALEKGLRNSKETPTKTLKYFLRIVRDSLLVYSENSDGFIIKKIDEAKQSNILSSPIFRALKEEDYSLDKMPVVFGNDSGPTISNAFEAMRGFVESITPIVEELIRNNSKIESKFNADFLYQTLWEDEQREILEALRKKYKLQLPTRIEEIFKDEWNNYSEYYIKKIIEDFSIEESFTYILDEISPYISRREDIDKKPLNLDKINKSLQDAVYVAETHWKKSISEYNEFWGTFDKNIFQSLAEMEHLEQIIAAALLRKVATTDKNFTKIFFENDQILEQKKYILMVALINYLELTCSSLTTITKDLQKKDLFEKLLKSLCDKIYQSIETNAFKIMNEYITSSADSDQNSEENRSTLHSKSVKILTKFNKKLLQLQQEETDDQLYITRFRESIKTEAQKIASQINNPIEGDGHTPAADSFLKEFEQANNAKLSSTHPLDFYYFLDHNNLKRKTQQNEQYEREKKFHKKEKAKNIRDTLFLEKLSAEQNEFLVDYTVIPVQKFTLKKKVEGVATRSDRRTAASEAGNRGHLEDGSGKNAAFALAGENIDQIAEKAKNIVGGVFKLFK